MVVDSSSGRASSLRVFISTSLVSGTYSSQKVRNSPRYKHQGLPKSPPALTTGLSELAKISSQI